MSDLKNAAETLVHYIKHACRDLPPDSFAELQGCVDAFAKADLELEALQSAAGKMAVHTLMTGSPR